jgi:hypothetical protein
MKNNITSTLCKAAVIAGLAYASTAQAVTSIGVQISLDGGAFTQQQVQLDDTAGDMLGLTPGTILHTFSLGNGLTISISATGNASGTGAPIMDIGIVCFLAAGHTATVEFSANGFTPPSISSYVTTAGVVGKGAYSVTETTRIGTGVNGNDLFAAGGTLPTIGPININQQGTTSGVAPAGTSNPYSITINEIISATADSTLSVDTTLQTVPDGGNTLMLLGSALSVLGGASMLRKKAVKA